MSDIETTPTLSVVPETPAEPEPAADSGPAEELPSLEQQLTSAVENLMRATQAGDGEKAQVALSEALAAFAMSTAGRYDGGIPVEGEDFEFQRTEQGIRVEGKTPNGTTLCNLWGEYTREMEYRALQQRVYQLSEVAMRHEQTIAAQQKQMDNMLVSFNQIRRKIRF